MKEKQEGTVKFGGAPWSVSLTLPFSQKHTEHATIHTHTHNHAHTHAGHSLGRLPGRLLVFELQISVLCFGLLETEGQTVRYELRTPETKTLRFSSKFLGLNQRSSVSWAVLDCSGPVCCTQNGFWRTCLAHYFRLTCMLPRLISCVLYRHRSPSRRSLWLWWPGCTRTRPSRWTCTGPQSAPGRSVALAPSGCI